MFREIARYVRECRNCLTHKADQSKPAGTLRASAVRAPWEQVAVDLIGPLPRSTQGHIWLITMQDRFSKWLGIRPLCKATAGAVTKAITEQIIYHHGCPHVLITDNGTQLKAAQLKGLLATLGIRHQVTPVYTPQCNPVERTNRSIKTMIAQFVRRNHRRWDEHLLALQFAYNTAKHEATSFSPAYITHGRELAGPHPGERGRIPEADTPHRVQKKIQEAQELVRINLARSFNRQEKYYNFRKRDWRPQIGEWVWKREHPLSKKEQGFNAKLAPRYIGPLEIRQIILPVIVDLRSKDRHWYRHIHVQELKRANPETAREDGNAAAAITNTPAILGKIPYTGESGKTPPTGALCTIIDKAVRAPVSIPPLRPGNPPTSANQIIIVTEKVQHGRRHKFDAGRRGSNGFVGQADTTGRDQSTGRRTAVAGATFRGDVSGHGTDSTSTGEGQHRATTARPALPGSRTDRTPSGATDGHIRAAVQEPGERKLLELAQVSLPPPATRKRKLTVRPAAWAPNLAAKFAKPIRPSDQRVRGKPHIIADEQPPKRVVLRSQPEAKAKPAEIRRAEPPAASESDTVRNEPAILLSLPSPPALSLPTLDLESTGIETMGIREATPAPSPELTCNGY